MPEFFVNRYQTALAAGVTSGALTGTVTSVTGVPAVPFRAIISAEGANTDEIVLVTARAGTTLTWTRAAEAVAGVQAASAHGIGATFTAIITAAGVVGASGSFDVRAYGTVDPTGIADSSAAIQAAIDAASAAGGGVVSGFGSGTYRCNITLKQGVFVVGVGLGAGFGYPPSGTAVYQTTLIAAAAGTVVDTPVGQTIACGISGINIRGLGAGTAVRGVRFRDVSWGIVKNVTFDQCADEGLLVESGSIACTFEDILAVDCVLNRSRAAVIGAVDIHGADNFVSRIEATISGSLEGTVQSVNLYCVGIAIRMANGFVHSCIGEFSDVGIHVSGDLNRVTGCRADLNYGHGWLVSGAGNQVIGSLALNNSQDTTNLYDGWHVSGVNNIFAIPNAESSTAKLHRYGFNDQAPSSGTNKNYYTSPRVQGPVGTGEYNFIQAEGPGVSFMSGAPKTLTVNSVTPNVSAWGAFTTANTISTVLTNFLGGVNGQVIHVLCADSNTIVEHNGSGFVLRGSYYKTLRSGVWYTFIKHGAWRLVGEGDEPNVSADNGDVAKTLVAGLNEPTQRWATPLGAARAVTLSTDGAYAGAKFRIVRTATATGASNLNVGTGPLKALAVGQWCDVEHNGTAWFLTAAGSL